MSDSPVSLIQPFFGFLSTSPDARHTFVSRLHWRANRGRVSCFYFRSGVLHDVWELPPNVTRSLTAWSEDSELFALYQPPRITVKSVRSGSELEAEVGDTVRRIFFTREGELAVQLGSRLHFYQPRMGLSPVHEVAVRWIDFLGGDYAYCDDRGSLFWGRSGFVSKAITADLGADPIHLALGGNQIYLIAERGSGVLMLRRYDVETKEALITNVKHSSNDVRVLGMIGNLLISQERTGTRRDILVHRVKEGEAETEATRLSEDEASLIRSIDGNRLLLTSTGQRKRVWRFDAGGMLRLFELRGDVYRLQADRTTVHTAVLADESCREWYLRLGGRRMVGLWGAGYSHASSRRSSARTALRRGSPAVIYIPSIFKSDKVWAQNTFFQHVIFSIVKALRRLGFEYRVLRSLHGLVPVDRHRLVSLVRDRLNACILELTKSGPRPTVLIAGSIASYAALSNVELLNGRCAVMLLSPVHYMTPMITGHIGLQGPDESEDAEAVIKSRAAGLRVPTAIVHGMRDELTPEYHSRTFVGALPEQVERVYHALPDEGHIFTSFESWELTARCFTTFAQHHCEQGGQM